MMWQILVLVLAIPVGLLVAYLARDELVAIRKYVRWLFILGLLVSVWMFLIGKQVESYTAGFAAILGIMAYWKSFDKKWIRKKT